MGKYLCCGPEQIEKALPTMIFLMVVQLVYSLIVWGVFLSNHTINSLLMVPVFITSLCGFYCICRFYCVTDEGQDSRKYKIYIRMAPIALLIQSVFSFLPCFTGFLEFLDEVAEPVGALFVFFISLFLTILWVHAFLLAMNESNTFIENIGDEENRPVERAAPIDDS
jgi:hypothetical protein